ncbi:Transcription factor TFIID complex subunit 8 C-term [Geosmithia morbida]|uniref:Transcription initiation factor TFIID subunit 8 n=1 Tax=Geosmithia morbida TaxID=1094350 RepID=A0A9P4YQP7_9HYPO|nr:Transcription factor TFIID complex subunit 8 C-term [Geosmithia morbida]KAF4121005.1 Transcription factor TFIID complex subunit 8 C-term [Geosmithia morbida]
MVSPKRGHSAENSEEPEPKRARLDSLEISKENTRGSQDTSSDIPKGFPDTAEDDVVTPFVSTAPTLHSQARLNIQRSIALILQHDGFDSSTPEALEGFTQMVETYIESIIGEAKWLAHSSRREYPTPVDYEKTLKRHNVSVSSLKVHLHPPIPKSKAAPQYTEAITLDDEPFVTLPILGPELSGQDDKDSKPHIPKTFPAFPSKHTYTFTPQEDVNTRDSKKLREQAAKTAQEGEEALRGLVRASKMRKQKEVKSLVEKDLQGKERYRLWEMTMKKFMGMESRGEHSDQVEVADHSMIVNSDSAFSRKEVSRLGKREGRLINGNVA